MNNAEFIAAHKARQQSRQHMNTIASISPIAGIDVLARRYADARATVAARIDLYQDELRALQRKHVPAIKQAAGVAAQRQSELQAEIAQHPDLFVKPRTLVLHGIKVGFQKGKGSIVCDDQEQAVERIEKHFGELAPLYLIITKKPKASALIELDVATLKKLGLAVQDTGDAVVIKAADGDVEKLVAQLLEEGAKED